jgi:hypothetical protein
MPQPSRFKLATRPSLAGSSTTTKTIGTVAVAAFATIAAGVPAAAITVIICQGQEIPPRERQTPEALGAQQQAEIESVLKKGKHASSLRHLLQVEPDTEAGALRTGWQSCIHSILTRAVWMTSPHLAESLRKYSAKASSAPGTGCTAKRSR